MPLLGSHLQYSLANEIHSGRDISKDFQRIVNRRVLPDYFDIIKEPVALSTLRVSLLVLRILAGLEINWWSSKKSARSNTRP